MSEPDKETPPESIACDLVCSVVISICSFSMIFRELKILYLNVLVKEDNNEDPYVPDDDFPTMYVLCAAFHALVLVACLVIFICMAFDMSSATRAYACSITSIVVCVTSFLQVIIRKLTDLMPFFTHYVYQACGCQTIDDFRTKTNVENDYQNFINSNCDFAVSTYVKEEFFKKHISKMGVMKLFEFLVPFLVPCAFFGYASYVYYKFGNYLYETDPDNKEEP